MEVAMQDRPKHVLVCDAGRARMFDIDPSRRHLVPTPVWELENEVAPSRELVTDRPGRGKRPGGTGSGEGRHQKGPGTDPHRHEKARFAHTVAEAVEGQRTRSRLDSLLVVAPPKMLGDLRNEFSDEVRSLVREEIPKDLANLKPAEIEDHFPEIFPRGA